MSDLEISTQTILISSMESPFSITLCNKSNKNIMLRLILTNPDQYQLSRQSSFLQPSQKVTLNIQIKLNPNINNFNYQNNSLHVLYTKPELDAKYSSQNFEIAKDINNIGYIKIPIKITLQLPNISEDAKSKLNRYVKIVQVSSLTGIILKHSPFLQELTSKFGKISSVIKHDSAIIAHYEEKVNIVPNVIINSNKERIIESVYSYAYPTQQDLDSLEESKGLSFVKVDEIFIPSAVNDFALNDQILTCKDDTKLFLLNINNHKLVSFQHQNFKIAEYPPYMCVVLEYKYLYFYENWGNPNIIKIKLKKLEVKCFCKSNNSLFAGGKNRSKISFKQSTLRREILIYQNFKVVSSELNPSKKIRLDDSEADVTMLFCQNPYIFAYCRPVIYLVNAQRYEVVIKLQRDLQCGLLLQGRYLKSLISFIGVTIEDRVLRINFDKMGVVYGVQIDQTPRKAYSIAQTKSGKVFMNQKDAIYEFNPVMTEVTNEWKPKEEEFSIIRKIKTNLKNQLMILRNTDKTSMVQFYTFE